MKLQSCLVLSVIALFNFASAGYRDLSGDQKTQFRKCVQQDCFADLYSDECLSARENCSNGKWRKANGHAGKTACKEALGIEDLCSVELDEAAKKELRKCKKACFKQVNN